ncbi:hypothetical protein GGS21DRAFT_521881 [Xylaria nigripes]|nr:hypothetical protein GGS21DRAFT_521881 [Xylaria nigripes]
MQSVAAQLFISNLLSGCSGLVAKARTIREPKLLFPRVCWRLTSPHYENDSHIENRGLVTFRSRSKLQLNDLACAGVAGTLHDSRPNVDDLHGYP